MMPIDTVLAFLIFVLMFFSVYDFGVDWKSFSASSIPGGDNSYFIIHDWPIDVEILGEVWAMLALENWETIEQWLMNVEEWGAHIIRQNVLQVLNTFIRNVYRSVQCTLEILYARCFRRLIKGAPREDIQWEQENPPREDTYVTTSATIPMIHPEIRSNVITIIPLALFLVLSMIIMGVMRKVYMVDFLPKIFKNTTVGVKWFRIFIALSPGTFFIRITMALMQVPFSSWICQKTIGSITFKENFLPCILHLETTCLFLLKALFMTTLMMVTLITTMVTLGKTIIKTEEHLYSAGEGYHGIKFINKIEKIFQAKQLFDLQ